MSVSPLLLKEKIGKYDYIVKCDTCQQIFFQTTLDNPQVPKIGMTPTKWYIEAARHWTRNQSHVINVHLINKESKLDEIVFSLSQDWTEKLQYQTYQSVEEMEAELDALEKALK